MNNISDKIKSGARAFLVTEYKYLAVYVLIVCIILVILYTLDPPSGSETDGVRYAACFLAGAFLSGAAGWGGMAVATVSHLGGKISLLVFATFLTLPPSPRLIQDANVRTTQAADQEGLGVALRVAFTGGAVMGFTVVALGLGGVCLMFFLVSLGYDSDTDLGDQVTPEAKLRYAADVLAGFGFGASSIALFARVAGGIYTKAADVGADLVGKVEMDIPEDDPRNPAVIADNVGDNGTVCDKLLSCSLLFAMSHTGSSSIVSSQLVMWLAWELIFSNHSLDLSLLPSPLLTETVL